ncbi:phenylacetate-CoA oxygenase subunit PaaC [Bacteroidota bacterium]|nr:phenylacetate-CoA oxygenase subunit PaaC [Bacteroidota bacterium]MDC3230019.1 phenylacetate-CoA oxygenase subunit PaaC [Bacteroidota bacterium]
MGQRLSELCSKGPYLEEDIAISNIALDYLGQANMLYELLKKAGNGKYSVDDYVFHRNERNYYNLLLVEQDNGHFGKTMAKIFLYSTYQKILYSQLSKSTNDDIKAIALKSIKEVNYHFKHSRAWVLRLGDGTKESKVKIQESIDELWRFTGEIFESDYVENNLISENIITASNTYYDEWSKIVKDTLLEALLTEPENVVMLTGGKKGLHTEKLGFMLAEMQYLPRTYPNAKW